MRGGGVFGKKKAPLLSEYGFSSHPKSRAFIPPDMMQSARLSEKTILREAVAGVIAKGSHRDPIVVACHILHVENYAAMVRRRFEGGGLVTAKFVMRADDVQPVEVIKEYEDAEKGEVLACFEALTSLRSLLMSKD